MITTIARVNHFCIRLSYFGVTRYSPVLEVLGGSPGMRTGKQP